jgi:hypothetical protein
MKMNIALNTFGRAYGQCCIHQTPSLPPKVEPGPNNHGKLLTGSASEPPKIGPIITPMLKHMGSSKKALDWYLRLY